MKSLIKTVAIILPCVLLGMAAQAETFIRMVSGPAGGSWYPLGAKIAEVLGYEVPAIAVSNGPGGSVGNVKEVNRGNAELGWTYAHTAYNGYSGKVKFDTAQPNIRHFATLYPSVLQTAVLEDSDIESFSDMKDKNLGPGKKNSSSYAAAKLVFKHHGLSIDQVKRSGGSIHYLGFKDSASLIRDGRLDVFLPLAGVPQDSLLDLDFSPGIRFIGIDHKILRRILAQNPGYVGTVIPAGAYESVSEDVPTLGIVTVLVINKDVPEEVAYDMISALWENHDLFVNVRNIWNSVRLEDALRGAAIPVHPGAQRYYDEMGVRKK
jgi:TRAP transporter TAXI family solute receptor